MMSLFSSGPFDATKVDKDDVVKFPTNSEKISEDMLKPSEGKKVKIVVQY